MAYEIYDDCSDIIQYFDESAASLNLTNARNILIGSSPHECHCDASFLSEISQTKAFKIFKDH